MTNQTRRMTGPEAKLVALLKIFEKATDSKAQVVKLTATKEAVKVLRRLEQDDKVCRILRLEEVNKDSYTVYMDIYNFCQYINYIAAITNLDLMMDGSIKAKDGYKITPDYSA